MCESQLEAKYRNLAQGTTLLESSLHVNIAEHVNSEIGLGTITNVESAKAWLRNSFLFQRLQRNPKHYAIGKDAQQTWQERLDQMILDSVMELKASKLIETPEDGEENQLRSTEYGDVMSKVEAFYSWPQLRLLIPTQFYIKQKTVSRVSQTDPHKLIPQR